MHSCVGSKLKNRGPKLTAHHHGLLSASCEHAKKRVSYGRQNCTTFACMRRCSRVPAAFLATAERCALFAMACMVAVFAAVRRREVLVMACSCLADYSQGTVKAVCTRSRGPISTLNRCFVVLHRCEMLAIV